MRKDERLANIITARTGSFVNGSVHFYYFVNTMPIKGLINIPYINDIPPMQMQYIGNNENEIEKSLNKYKNMAKSINAFLGLNKTFCETVKRLYCIDANVPYGYFASFPPWFESPHKKRNEIVYLDNSSKIPYGFNEHLTFLDMISKASGIKTLFVSRKFSKEAADIRNKNKLHVDIIHDTYDFASKYGILMNTKNFNQAHMALPRKLLMYLMCGMNVLTDSSWTESINFMIENGTNPYIYKDTNDINRLQYHDFGTICPRNFCLEERVKSLDEQLTSLAEMAGH